MKIFIILFEFDNIAFQITLFTIKVTSLHMLQTIKIPTKPKKCTT
jgi:hypothetical protein